MIRPATHADTPRILEFGEQFHLYGGFAARGLRFDPESLAQFCAGLSSSDVAVLLVAEKDGAVIGTVAGVISPWFLDNSQTVAMETWWWVDPKHRGGTAGVRLLEAFEQWKTMSTLLLVDDGPMDLAMAVRRAFMALRLTWDASTP